MVAERVVIPGRTVKKRLERAGLSRGLEVSRRIT